MRILRIGLKGDDVVAAQNELNNKGFSLVVDGYFGPAMDKAVKQFQTNHGLLPDGIIGEKTNALLQVNTPGPTPAPIPVGAVRPKPLYTTLAQLDANLEKGTAAWYQNAYLIMVPDQNQTAAIEAAAKRVKTLKESYYSPLEAATGIPWAMTASIHSMECGNAPDGCLHNGQRIIGRNLKTTIVPIGRGPFNKYPTLAENWLDGAKDAVSGNSLWHVPNWSIGYILKQIERFNGTGYLQYHHQENSPYLWARTDINDGTGKYTSDGHWDPNADADAQVGAAAILRKLEDWGDFKMIYSGVA